MNPNSKWRHGRQHLSHPGQSAFRTGEAGAVERRNDGTRTAEALTPQRRQLVKLMQTLCFGRIEGFAIRDGEPVLTPPPRVIREVKFGSEPGPRPDSRDPEFVLKAQVTEFFDQMDRFRDGVLETVEVKHGLPFRAVFEETLRP